MIASIHFRPEHFTRRDRRDVKPIGDEPRLE
jgi:hypothetical protein